MSLDQKLQFGQSHLVCKLVWACDYEAKMHQLLCQTFCEYNNQLSNNYLIIEYLVKFYLMWSNIIWPIIKCRNTPVHDHGQITYVIIKYLFIIISIKHSFRHIIWLIVWNSRTSHSCRSIQHMNKHATQLTTFLLQRLPECDWAVREFELHLGKAIAFSRWKL